MQRERLSKYLRPKHPKIVKLDADIERAEQLQELYRQPETATNWPLPGRPIKMKTDNVMASIKEWEAKVVEANATHRRSGTPQAECPADPKPV